MINLRSLFSIPVIYFAVLQIYRGGRKGPVIVCVFNTLFSVICEAASQLLFYMLLCV